MPWWRTIAGCSTVVCDGVAVLGTTGEANLFSVAERRAGDLEDFVLKEEP